jgi:DNA-binding transcriptional regulator YdaS (Cro superfamily)
MLDPWKVRKLAEARGLGNDSALARAIGVTKAAVGNMYHYRDPVSAARVAAALGCTVVEIDSGADERAAGKVAYEAWRKKGRPSIVVSP